MTTQIPIYNIYRLPSLPPTSFLLACMLGCLVACLLACLLHWGQHFCQSGKLWCACRYWFSWICIVFSKFLRSSHIRIDFTTDQSPGTCSDRFPLFSIAFQNQESYFHRFFIGLHCFQEHSRPMCGDLWRRSPNASRGCTKGSCSLHYRKIAVYRMVEWKVLQVLLIAV